MDLGRGEAADFERHAAAIPGRIVLVRHEYMFRRRHRAPPAQTMPGRWSAARRDSLIASHLAGELPVTGSSGAEPGRGIPARQG